MSLLPLLLATAFPLAQDDAFPKEITSELVGAVDRGLEWLAAHQEPDGSWLGDVGYKLNSDYAVVLPERPHLGVTALAGMAFLAGGHVPGRGRYGPVVERCLDWVLSCVTESGYVRANESRMYDHAFATLFLAEIYGMTRREDIRAKLQRAVDLVRASQNALGGWRYEPFAPDADMSVTVCQVVALRAARNIGIRVPRSTIDAAIRYVKESAVRGGFALGSGEWTERGTFRYQREHHSRASWALTAAGITTLYGAGVYSDEDIEYGLEHLLRNQERESLASGGGRDPRTFRGHYFFWYGHYYAVQAMYIAGGAYWERYFAHIRRLLLEVQNPDGSWTNRVGPGPAFGTAVATLILEIPYRYLPIFQR